MSVSVSLFSVRHLGLKGYRVAILDINEEKLAEANGALKEAGVEAVMHVATNVTDEESVNAAVTAVTTAWGRIDALVQSAGITGRTGIKTTEVELKDWEMVFKVNSTGVFLMAKAVIPTMETQGSGRILNIASVAGKEGNAGMLAYSASKAAVIGLTKSMGKEYAESGITINALAPAVIRTAMVEAMPDTQVKYMTDKIPMKRCGSLDEIANMCAFIVSPECSFTTGFTFDMTGGRATY